MDQCIKKTKTIKDQSQLQKTALNVTLINHFKWNTIMSALYLKVNQSLHFCKIYVAYTSAATMDQSYSLHACQ